MRASSLQMNIFMLKSNLKKVFKIVAYILKVKSIFSSRFER